MTKTLSFYLVLLVLLTSCSKDVEEPQLSAYDLEVISYFKEVALGFEFGTASEITRRWEGGMKIFVGGNPSPTLLVELGRVADEINALSTSGFSIQTTPDSLQSNFYVFFGSGSSFADMFPNIAGLVASNYGLFFVYWSGWDQLYRGYMYVDIIRATPTEQLHLLREELTQSLGLARDSPLYPESIFQASYSTKTTEYAQIDRDLIRLLYHPDMRVGLNESQVDITLKQILLHEL